MRLSWGLRHFPVTPSRTQSSDAKRPSTGSQPVSNCSLNSAPPLPSDSQPLWMRVTLVPWFSALKSTSTVWASDGGRAGWKENLTLRGGSQASTVPHTSTSPSFLRWMSLPPSSSSNTMGPERGTPRGRLLMGHQLAISVVKRRKVTSGD